MLNYLVVTLDSQLTQQSGNMQISQGNVCFKI